MNIKSKFKQFFPRLGPVLEENDQTNEQSDEMSVFILDESNRVRYILRPLIKEFFAEFGIEVGFGSIDSEERFQRFLRNISIDVDLFILTTRSEHYTEESEWEERYEALRNNNRIKNILIFSDEEHLDSVFAKTQENPNTFLYLRNSDVSQINKSTMTPCLNQLIRAT